MPQPPVVAEDSQAPREFSLTPSGTKASTPAREAQVEIVQQKQCKWDFFLSHKQSNAQDTIQNLRMVLQERMPGASFWLDVEQDPTERGMCHGVCHSKDIIIYLTEGYTASKYCQMEMRWALEAGKNIILVQETDERHGKCSIDLLLEKCPEELKQIFADNVAIPWFRDPDFRAVSVEKIMRNRFKNEEIVNPESTKGKPLMFAHGAGTDSEGTEDSEGHAVFHRSFVIFTAMCGVALPGAGQNTKRWAIAVRVILLTCGLMCCSRVFTTEGPAFLDHETIMQIVVAHPVIFLFLHVTLNILESDLVADLLANRIDCSGHSSWLRFKTKLLTGLSILLTVSLSLWGWAAYLPGFFADYYLNPGSFQKPTAFILFGVAHGLTWILILPIFFGSLFSALLIMFVLQELCFMAILTAYNELHPELASRGLEEVAKADEGLHISENDLYRFQVIYRRHWKIYRTIQFRAAVPFLAFWVLEMMLMSWSVWSLLQGFEPAYDDPRVERLRSNWNLIVRLSWFMGSSLWFGAGCYIVALVPWGVTYYAWRSETLTRRLLFTRPELRNTFRNFLKDFDINFHVLFLRATPWTLLAFLPVLIINTLGFEADAARLISAL